MAKQKIKVEGKDIAIETVNGLDNVSLTDIAKSFDSRPDELIRSWIRNRNTVEFIEAWEILYNKDFKPGQLDGIKQQTGLNRFRPSVSQFIKMTGAIGIYSKAGRYGGSYAHKDIAYHFCMWLSGPFALLVIREFDRLKADEAQKIGEGGDTNRYLSKINYFIHTEAVRDNLPLMLQRTKKEGIYHASEADLLNEVVFGMTAKEWRIANPDKDGNMRDHATADQLHVLANLEALNAEFLDMGLMKDERRQRLFRAAEKHLSIIESRKNR